MEFLILNISHKRPHAVHFFYFITYTLKKNYDLLFDVNIHTPNLSSTINLIIDKNKFK